ncbi:unnamed protein product [Linum tenue]|uniref:Protein NUCLEAR FUSION DEFECTIVE 6, chloroplastic/mitochondrial n=1 Tax=Linum tenue TaxID=586396 RepID=A0AAV0GWE7_9ROSI|nr:unnamed protein product [Linum tenue]
MASICRSAVMAGARSLAPRSRTLTQNSLFSSSAFSSPSATRVVRSASRVVSTLGSVESLIPFHSATANARLISSIAADSSCWSWLSQVYF